MVQSGQSGFSQPSSQPASQAASQQMTSPSVPGRSPSVGVNANMTTPELLRPFTPKASGDPLRGSGFGLPLHEEKTQSEKVPEKSLTPPALPKTAVKPKLEPPKLKSSTPGLVQSNLPKPWKPSAAMTSPAQEMARKGPKPFQVPTINRFTPDGKTVDLTKGSPDSLSYVMKWSGTRADDPLDRSPGGQKSKSVIKSSLDQVTSATQTVTDFADGLMGWVTMKFDKPLEMSIG
ncbi:MAG: hypothetical protein K2X01_08625 [Cyanobacteria bacterium]|nr:hypothetical protein [Cyanobacteriota bacterium]